MFCLQTTLFRLEENKLIVVRIKMIYLGVKKNILFLIIALNPNHKF